MPPPSAPAAPVAPKPPPSVTLVQTVNIENGTTTFNYTSFNNNGYNSRKPDNMVNLGGGILNSGVNFNSGAFNPAQQYTPASEVLPGYQPGNRATLPPQAVSFFFNSKLLHMTLIKSVAI